MEASPGFCEWAIVIGPTSQMRKQNCTAGSGRHSIKSKQSSPLSVSSVVLESRQCQLLHRVTVRINWVTHLELKASRMLLPAVIIAVMGTLKGKRTLGREETAGEGKGGGDGSALFSLLPREQRGWCYWCPKVHSFTSYKNPQRHSVLSSKTRRAVIPRLWSSDCRQESHITQLMSLGQAFPHWQTPPFSLGNWPGVLLSSLAAQSLLYQAGILLFSVPDFDCLPIFPCQLASKGAWPMGSTSRKWEDKGERSGYFFLLYWCVTMATTHHCWSSHLGCSSPNSNPSSAGTVLSTFVPLVWGLS